MMAKKATNGALTLLVLLSLFQGHRAFIPSPKHQYDIRGTSSLLSTPADDNTDGGAWKLNNDYPQFLNQVAIQSFLTVLRSLRDPQTIRWVDNFTQPVIPDSRDRASNRLTGTTEATNAITSEISAANPDGKSYSKLLTYHGLGALNSTLYPTWDSYYATLLEQPTQVLIVQSSGIQVKDYELDINPASLCTRLISVREQIAEEMAHDLQVVANMGYHTMDSYSEYMDTQVDKDDKDDDDTKQFTEIGSETAAAAPTDKDEVTMSSGDARPRRLTPHNLVFLDYSLDKLGDKIPSTLRKGNFDLVVLLATQEAIHRILNNQQTEEAGKDFDICQKYLVDFYAQRLVSHFSGIQRYGRADDFLEELLFSSPRVSTDGGFAALVDPVRITELILDERRQVALEWSARSKDVPNDHIAIKRLQLNALMQSYQ